VIVADTNLVAYLLIEGEKTDLARAVWTTDSQWMLPTLWRSEFLNVLTTSVREKVLTLQDAHDIWNVAQTVFGQSEVEPSGDAVLETAAARNLSAYDAQFVVAASDLEIRLITSDRRLLKACPDIAIAPETFTASEIV
jgi:predicted nucleic acid-binding protein